MTKSLPIKQTPAEMLRDVANKYREEVKATERTRVLIYGSSGSGKTYSLNSFKFPLWIDSFDPGGSIFHKKLAEQGQAIIVSKYEDEDFMQPTAFKTWDDDFTKNYESGIFSGIGTYVLDSATTWGQAALNVILKKAGRTGGVPQQNDWFPQMVLMEAALRKIQSLPCDVVFICHDEVQKDEITGKITRGPMLTGKLKKRIPLLFGEIYFADVQRTSKGPNYVWQLAKDSTNEARSRLAALAATKFDSIEPQNFRDLMKKGGYSYEDLPPINFGE